MAKVSTTALLTVVLSVLTSIVWIAMTFTSQWIIKIIMIGPIPMKMDFGLTSIQFLPYICSEVFSLPSEGKIGAFFDKVCGNELWNRSHMGTMKDYICAGNELLELNGGGNACGNITFLYYMAYFAVCLIIVAVVLMIFGSLMIFQYQRSGFSKGRFKADVYKKGRIMMITAVLICGGAIGGFYRAADLTTSSFEKALSLPFIPSSKGAWLTPNEGMVGFFGACLVGVIAIFMAGAARVRDWEIDEDGNIPAMNKMGGSDDEASDEESSDDERILKAGQQAWNGYGYAPAVQYAAAY